MLAYITFLVILALVVYLIYYTVMYHTTDDFTTETALADLNTTLTKINIEQIKRYLRGTI
jgi:hypothetical protein